MPASDRDALAVLLSVQGLGPLTLARLVGRLGTPSAILALAGAANAADRLVDASRSDAGSWHAMPSNVADALVEAAGDAPQILAEVRRMGVRVVTPTDPDYPRRLLGIELPPPALFVRGSLAALSSPHVVAVVGTRRPSPPGRRIASRIAAALTKAGATVVSGLAIGIDGAAHAAVVAEQAATVAFIGGGHARLFPRAHDRLADAIVAAGGAVASEYAPRVEPSRGTFPQRNRLISGSADAVVVVEAGARSGALVTASWALEQGRDCFVVPGPIDAPTSAGCNGFLRDWHDLARIVSGIPQLLDDLGLLAEVALPGPGHHRGDATSVEIKSTVKPPTARAMLSGRSEAEQAVAEALVHGAVTVDELVAVTRRSLGEVLRALTRLEAIGLARASHGRYEPAGSLASADPVAA
ncbi:MAG TPA: DNA-processing protein DprA [Candidatus Dormibacteraeota bacterium]|nr:DNA-processing protein DprA [Candidatus Dormibacteraeota bacterium]